jgi:hypothetical protein
VTLTVGLPVGAAAVVAAVGDLAALAGGGLVALSAHARGGRPPIGNA